MTGAADAAATRPALTHSLTMRMMSPAVRAGEGVEGGPKIAEVATIMLKEDMATSSVSVLPEMAEVTTAALEEAEVDVTGGADNDGLLGGWPDVSTPHRPEGGALAPTPVSPGKREAVAPIPGMVTTGGMVHPLEPPGMDLWVWSWVIKSWSAIYSWD